MLWHSSLFPSMHCSIACVWQRKLVVAPSLSAWWHHRVVLEWGNGSIINTEAVLMCLIVFTNPSSGLFQCQCCMISVEHGSELKKAGLVHLHQLYQPVSICCAPLCMWHATTDSGHLSLTGSVKSSAPKEFACCHNLSCWLFSISQETSRRCCSDYHDICYRYHTRSDYLFICFSSFVFHHLSLSL